jgi:GT2 family glycosyltransferase
MPPTQPPIEPTTAEAARPRRAPVHAPGWAQSYAVGEPIDITVCIASWNCRELMRNCLRSLLEQPQGVSLEVVVVDNASTDGVDDMIAAEFPEVTLVRNATNAGFSRANNQAARRARGRYLFFLNNDTVIPPGTLAKLVDFADAHPEVGMVGPRLRDGHGQLQISYRRNPSVCALLHRTALFRWTGLLRRAYRHYRRQTFDPQSTRRVPVLMGAAVLIPRAVFDQVDGWDEAYEFGGEDVDLSLRVNRSHPVVYLPSVEITHFGRVSSRLNAEFSEPNVAVGYARFLRAADTHPLALLAYKLAVTADAPVQLVGKYVQGGWRWLHGRRDKARKSLLAARGLRSFLLRHLIRFWQV